MKKLELATLAVLVFLVCFVLMTLVWHRHSQKQELIAAREEVLPKLRVIMEEMATRRRPVLRGEAIPGDGGGELQALLLKLEDQDIEGGSYYRWKVWAHQEPYAEELQQPKGRAACEAVRLFLPRMRELIQHESCNPTVDLTQGNTTGYPMMGTIDLVIQGLIEAKAHAVSGDRAEALALVADVIRFGQDVYPGDRFLKDFGLLRSLLQLVQKTCSEMLYSHRFAPEELDDFLAELLVLEEDLPDVHGAMGVIEVAEYLLIVRYANAWASGLAPPEEPMWLGGGFPSLGMPDDSDWREAFATERFNLAEVRELFAQDRRNYATKPLRDLRREYREFLDSETVGPFSPFAPSALWLREAELDILTRLRCLRVAVQVHKYRAEHEGAWPSDLSEIGEVPLDPWDGKPLRYRQAKGGLPPFIYSVGYNLVDDGGSGTNFHLDDMESSLDYIFHLVPWWAADDAATSPDASPEVGAK